MGLAPALDQRAWRQLLESPGFAQACRLSLITGVGSTLLALLLAVGLVAWRLGGPRPDAPAWLPSLLALPHAAFALGLAFLLAPSGLLVRLAAPALHLRLPPDLATVQDPGGLAMTLGLALREAPFLAFVLLAAAATAGPDLRHRLAVSRTLGAEPGQAFLRIAWPALAHSLRLPLVAVLAYGLAAVDVAAILGPQSPAPLGVWVVRLASDADPTRRAAAACGALLLAALPALLWLLLAAVTRDGRQLPLPAAAAGPIGASLRGVGRVAGVVLPTATALPLLVLALWSLAVSWPWPAPLPTAVTTGGWTSLAPGLGRSLGTTLTLALATALPALLLAAGCLEARRSARPGPGARLLPALLLPLALPQAALLPGLLVVLLTLGLHSGPVAVGLAQFLVVFPYTLLVLAGPWAAFDRRRLEAARLLGAGPLAAWWRVGLPLLAPGLAAAFAVGFSVSVALYLPTLLAGGGRVATLATETVALAGGGDRRAAAVAALLLTGVTMAPFLLASWLSRQVDGGCRAGQRRAGA